ncbi:hypothetical protein ELH70_14565 [Rhizobium ruizarguesonis]|uniref:hypothetical protein n=1 Tax=Rhizobium ruizarguesonis TaxID=2081791 RepID=UPI001031F4B6|nr:hypothetical protein [Rhizobium ruizarguesonis]TAZ73794.1 hypothetical protein ELH70_14565 [Rhizobium ruizarguesonis]TAZ86776.1 hypothetical protein ELH69_37805 [Rhizobium ruizarguesonis]
MAERGAKEIEDSADLDPIGEFDRHGQRTGFADRVWHQKKGVIIEHQGSSVEDLGGGALVMQLHCKLVQRRSRLRVRRLRLRRETRRARDHLVVVPTGFSIGIRQPSSESSHYVFGCG